MIFRIADNEFHIATAVLDAFIDSEAEVLAWGIEVTGSPRNVDELPWEPSAKCEVMLRTGPHELGSWWDLAGRSVTWQVPETEKGDTIAILYIFEHNPIYNSSVRLDRGHDGLVVTWNGFFDPYIDTRYHDSVPFHIQAPLVFQGIWCGRRPEEESRQELCPFFDQAQFHFTKNKHGVSLLMPITKPPQKAQQNLPANGTSHAAEG